MELSASATSRTAALKKAGAAQKLLAFASLILLVVFFSLSSANFFKFDNIIGILLATAVTGVLALGSTFVIITGGIDLAVGTVMTFCSVIAGVIITFGGMPIPYGILGAVGAGALCGAVSGFAVAYLKIPPFIATLAVMMITKGLSLVISGTKPIYFVDTPAFAKIAMESSIAKLIPGLAIPNAVFIYFGMAILASLLLTKTIVGRYNFALGSNEEAARLSGINVRAWKLAIYTITGVFSGVAGIIMASRLNSAQPALGQGYELEAIAAVVIGGTSLFGGEGGVIGTLVGIMLIGVLNNGLVILGVSSYLQPVVIGAIIVLSVFIDRLVKQRR